jgi:outer membrane protein TolC
MMKIYLKKLLAVLMTCSVLAALPLYAAEPKASLTLEEAIESAYRYSDQISLNSKEYDLLKEQLKANEGGAFVSYQTVYLTKAKNEQQKQILKDQIAYDITNRYNALVTLQTELSNLEANIALNTKKLTDMALKKKVGLVTTTEYDSLALQLEMQKNTKAAKSESLINDQNYFKILTGKDVSKYSLEDQLSYEPFRISGPIDSYINNKIADYLKYDTDIVQLQADNIITEGSAPMEWSVYLGQKYKVDTQISGLENTQKALRQALMTTYSSLLSLEEQIVTLQSQLQLLEKQLSTAKLQYQVGLMTSLDYNIQLLKLEDVKYNLRNLVTNYNSLKDMIQKPWVSGGSMQQQGS